MPNRPHGSPQRHSGQSEPTVSTILLRVLADVMQQRGVTPGELLGSGVELLYGEPAERMQPLHELRHALAHAARLAREPALGLHCGLQARESSFGLMSPLVAHAPTLRHAFELVMQYQGLVADCGGLRIVERGGIVQLRLELVAQALVHDRMFIELATAGLVRMLRSFGCQRREIRSVCFEYERPAHHAAYTLAFEGAECFSRSFTGVEVEALALDRPNLHYHAELHGVVVTQAKRRKDACMPATCSASSVRAMLRAAPAAQLPSMDEVARKLGVSVRSLRRKLDDEGTSFRELTQELLYELARSLLSDSSLSLQGVAYELGFADATAFNRAFRRWTNLTPRTYQSGAQRG